jgi:hypothetical protein
LTDAEATRESSYRLMIQLIHDQQILGLSQKALTPYYRVLTSALTSTDTKGLTDIDAAIVDFGVLPLTIPMFLRDPRKAAMFVVVFTAGMTHSAAVAWAGADGSKEEIVCEMASSMFSSLPKTALVAALASPTPLKYLKWALPLAAVVGMQSLDHAWHEGQRAEKLKANLDNLAHSIQMPSLDERMAHAKVSYLADTGKEMPPETEAALRKILE